MFILLKKNPANNQNKHKWKCNFYKFKPESVLAKEDYTRLKSWQQKTRWAHDWDKVIGSYLELQAGRREAGLNNNLHYVSVSDW